MKERLIVEQHLISREKDRISRTDSLVSKEQQAVDEPDAKQCAGKGTEGIATAPATHVIGKNRQKQQPEQGVRKHGGGDADNQTDQNVPAYCLPILPHVQLQR